MNGKRSVEAYRPTDATPAELRPSHLNAVSALLASASSPRRPLPIFLYFVKLLAHAMPQL
jgi:hypothetical protein